MTKYYAIGGLMSLLASPPVIAQNLTEMRNNATTVSVYAQQQIDLLPGFEATVSGFEAKIQLPVNVAGRWSAPLPWTPYIRPLSNGGNGVDKGMIGIHTHVLPNGNVLTWEGHNSNTSGNPALHTSHAYTWNPNPNARNGNVVYPKLYTHYDNEDSNIFCSGHTFMADGRLLVAGGHYSDGPVVRPQPPLIIPFAIPYTDVPYDYPLGGAYVGLRDVNSFNFAGGSTIGQLSYAWQTSSITASRPTLREMISRRWYPTNTTLANGDVLVVAGQQYGGPVGSNTTVQATIPEVYLANTNTWQSLTNASWQLPLYPWMFLAPDGQVFNAGPNPNTRFLNPTATAIGSTAAGTWGNAIYPSLSGQTREAGSAAMYAPGKILILGGGTNTAEIIDITASGTAAFSPAAPMQFARTHVNATLLADGSVLATGGLSSINTNDAPAVLPAELWNPPPPHGTGAAGTGTWTTMNAMAVPRQYHSTAVLLPDATVLSAGSGQGGSGLTTWDHPDYEIFTPPYLCQGRNRP